LLDNVSNVAIISHSAGFTTQMVKPSPTWNQPVSADLVGAPQLDTHQHWSQLVSVEAFNTPGAGR
jgi:hypothetical protein